MTHTSELLMSAQPTTLASTTSANDVLPSTEAHVTTLSADIAVTGDVVNARIVDGRHDAVAAFAPLTEAQRRGLAVDAWSIGLRALVNAHRHAEEARLADVGKTLIEDIDEQLKSYVERQQTAFLHTLGKYFDPHDGQVVARLEGFLRDEGELARTMARFLSPEDGELAKTLARELGENSPLLRRLSPTDGEGILALLEQRVHEVLQANQAELARALDPTAEDGAVARFLRTLRKEMAKADDDRNKQLALATKALDANDKNSAVSRLMRETSEARKAFVSAMNPEVAGSPMAVLKTALTTLLQTHAKSQQEAMKAFQERQTKLDTEIREALARLEERKRGDAKSTRGGFTFQDAVVSFVTQAVVGAPVVVDVTGNSTGARPNCRVGDQVVRFNAESAFAGAAFVVEAKRDASYTVTKALQELEVARSNRDAGIGVFVLARSHAPAGFPSFARHGSDILVVWDDSDEATDPYLHAAILLAFGLTTRRKRPEDAGDIKALADIEHRIQAELARLDRMRKLSESIRKNAEELGEEIRKGGDKLGLLLRNAKSTLKALDVELKDAEVEAEEPLQLQEQSLPRARGALRASSNNCRPLKKPTNE